MPQEYRSGMRRLRQAEAGGEPRSTVSPACSPRVPKATVSDPPPPPLAPDAAVMAPCHSDSTRDGHIKREHNRARRIIARSTVKPLTTLSRVYIEASDR